MDFKDPMVIRSLAFIRALKREYGDEVANKAWDAVTDAIGDPELTYEIYKCMLNGGFGRQDFTITHWKDTGYPGKSGSPKVFAIKTLRSWTGEGLKASKDAIDAAQKGIPTKMQVIKRTDEHGYPLDIEYGKFQRDMVNCGITIEME